MWLRLKPFKCLWVFVLHLYHFHACCQWKKEESITTIVLELNVWDTYAHKHTCEILLVLYLPMCCHEIMEKMETRLTTLLNIFMITFLLLSDSGPQASKQITNDKYLFFLVFIIYLPFCISFLFIGLLPVNFLFLYSF